ncbi:MAG: hypothetical protein NTZ97_03815 [Candidatus Moranbacteria bacterium]|nr:hypothetical protein [Candidatus Moranbacteria bacterium]
MIDKKLKEALELIGGRAILKEENQYYILMTLREFKKLRQEAIGGLTKQELVDRINNDIAAWKVVQEEEKISEMDLGEMAKQEIESDEVRYEKTEV